MAPRGGQDPGKEDAVDGALLQWVTPKEQNKRKKQLKEGSYKERAVILQGEKAGSH